MNIPLYIDLYIPKFALSFKMMNHYKIERDNDNPENKRENLIFRLGEIYTIQ